MIHERPVVPVQGGEESPENKFEREARQYAEKNARPLARREAQAVIAARKEMGHITPEGEKTEYDLEYGRAYEEHYWYLFHQKLKELSSGEEEE